MRHLLIIILSISNFYGNAANIYTDTIQKVNENILYKVTRDDTNIYLNMSTTDKKTCVSMLKRGLIVYFDTKGKEKKEIYVKYPIRTNPKQTDKNTSSSNKDFSSKEFDIDKIIEELPYEAEYGYFDETEQFHKSLNRLGISLGFKYTVSNELLEFHIKIPKDKISSGKTKNLSKLLIGVVTNKPEKSSNKEKSQNSSGTINRSGKGGMKSGSMKRGGMGRNSTGHGNKQRQNSAVKPESIDFWFDANMTEK